MTVPVEKPASPGTAHQSRKLSTDNVPRNRTSKGFRRNPRSNAAPRKGAVSAAMAPAHFDRDATTACPFAPATCRAVSGSMPSSSPLAIMSAPIMSRAKYGANT